MAQSELSRRWTAARQSVRTQLWPLPLFGILLALGAGVGLPQLDLAVTGSLPPTLANYLFGGGAGAASTVLDAVASSLITVTSLTFSLTVVTLQLASSQFSPRLLRTFMRDRMVHVTLALFLATFTYALTVLRTVRSAEGDQEEFVPRLSVTVAFVGAVASVIALVAFLAHLAKEIRVETMIRNVHRDASATVGAVLSDRESDDDHPEPPPGPPAGARPLLARRSGFLGVVEEEDLLGAAIDADAVVFLDRMPGASITAGTPIGATWTRIGADTAGARASGSQARSSDARDRVQEAVDAALDVEAERTDTLDVSYGLRQLTDVAAKALSPGVNDPTTAVHTLAQTCALLCEMASKQLGPRVLRDDDGHVRVVLRRPTFEELVELGVTQPRRYGAADPAVLYRVGTLLRDLAWVARPDHHAVLRGQLTRWWDTVAEQDFDGPQRATLAAVHEQVEAALLGRWTRDESLA